MRGACLDFVGTLTVWLSPPRLSLFLWKREPHLGNPRPERINVSRCDMDRERVSNIAGLCLTANLTAWFVWQELEVSMERQLHIQNQLVLGTEMLSLCLAFLHNAEGFQQEIMTMAGSYLRRSGVRQICIPLPQLTRTRTLTLLAGAAHTRPAFLRYGDVSDAWDWVWWREGSHWVSKLWQWSHRYLAGFSQDIQTKLFITCNGNLLEKGV